MTDDLIRKLCDEIARCEVARLDSLHEYDMEKLSLSALNSRLTEYDGRIKDAKQRLTDMNASCRPTTSGSIETLSPDMVSTEWDVFISYQRDSEKEAQEVNRRLTEAGLRVWQDVNDIRHTDQWPQAIDGALRQTDRLVLLISPASMQSREVFNEWFYFYTQHKPIHCLLLDDCEIHYQLLPYQYLDWRKPDERDWTRLIRELRADFTRPAPVTPSPIVSAPGDASYETPFADLLQAARDPNGSIALTDPQIKQLVEHKPQDFAEYFLGCIAEWSQPRYALDRRFVNLTLLLDKGEDAEQRWQSAEDTRFDDLRDVLAKVDDPSLVLLGAPGSGKSTLLRRLQMDHCLDQLRDDGDRVTFFIQLNGYRGNQTPLTWLNAQWTKRYPDLPALDTLLRAGRVLLLLDALNEMPHKSTAEYHERVAMWRSLTLEVVAQGNRVVYSCRSLDYSASLSSKELRVPQIEVQPMSAEQVRTFITLYSPTQAERVWMELDGSPQFDLFRTPIYLKLLLDQVERYQRVPKGKAELFTQFIRQQIVRNLDHPLLSPNGLLTGRDHTRLTQNRWKTPFELPERGVLIRDLSRLAFAMQESGLATEGALVRIDYDDACKLLDGERDEDILKAGVALTVLDEDIAREEITFFHQLLQEFFAARRLAEKPNPTLVDVKWHVDEVSPMLDEVLATLTDGDPLPPLPQTGWEETTLTATPMARDPNAFIRDLMPHNLALAARCAASPEIDLDPDLKRDLQNALIARSQDFANADLRARIAAGLALGELGDPRFERKTGPHGDYLLPPLITIPAGTYPMGDDNSQHDDEKPAHIVELDTFQIGQFPVTNAEYALFMAAGGYDDERWWDTDKAKAWLRGEASTESSKQQWRDNKKIFENWPEEHFWSLLQQNRITSEQADQWIAIRNMSDDELEAKLEQEFPSGKIYLQPEYWDDTRFNNPAQPVVGVTWFEARAYCNWLSVQTEQRYTLPSEAQFEASARGIDGRSYPYGESFDLARSNTFESHIRRTTPVGIFDNATPEGGFDLSGNAYTWTISIHKQDRFPYPYRADDGRENVHETNVRRVLRGGSWRSYDISARAMYRGLNFSFARSNYFSFRLCRPPSVQP